MPKIYKIKRIPNPKLPRPGVVRQPAQPGETLTGYIGDFKASDIEERTSRALEAQKIGYQFRAQFIPSNPPVVIHSEAGRNQLGAVEADFVFEVGGLVTAVQIDGEFAHKTAAQHEHDKEQDAKLNEVLRQLGGGVVVRIPFYYLKTQEQTDNTINALLSGQTEF